VRLPGDSISFLFSGQVSDETMSGSVFLGEYLTARFSAKRVSYRNPRESFMIPGGPPLAT
jgi:D-glucosaminate-6-phosphate ammonia-lyase